MTLEEAFTILIHDLDAAYLEIRNFHVDLEFTNPCHSPYKDATQHFMNATSEIFQMKELLYHLATQAGSAPTELISPPEPRQDPPRMQGLR